MRIENTPTNKRWIQALLSVRTTSLQPIWISQYVKMLQKLTTGDTTIICTIRQPSSSVYEMFDHVYLLTDKRCIYRIVTKNTINYFANFILHYPKYHNPTDCIIIATNYIMRNLDINL
ncbi:ATP-binding cassette sub-family G member 1-like [Vespula maculifrons]|uniref:ATP-binding cassette sub-family G member 1-like n=1 Tax=Vespula maculifrons TaxID=7453 RepID=A0ABD2B9A6_VESMC